MTLNSQFHQSGSLILLLQTCLKASITSLHPLILTSSFLLIPQPPPMSVCFLFCISEVCYWDRMCLPAFIFMTEVGKERNVGHKNKPMRYWGGGISTAAWSDSVFPARCGYMYYYAWPFFFPKHDSVKQRARQIARETTERRHWPI